MLTLKLRALPATLRGIYATKAGPGTLPERFRYLWPEAAVALLAFEADKGPLIYTDMFRAPIESLEAMKVKKGVMAPGWSGHNFGFSVDVAVGETLALHGWTYPELLAALEAYDWFCHRRDGARGSECWHFNHLPGGYARYTSPGPTTGWAAPVERRIQTTYGPLTLSETEVQAALTRLGLYHGEHDGVHGPLTRQGLLAFQRTWMLTETGTADLRTQRLLAVVTAERELCGA